MTDHLRRIREHTALETQALLLEAERARLFDHNTNRGSEAEHSILRWLRARVAPSYTLSSGEIIDSFDTNSNLASRQQDGILHRNDADANRFLLPSGMRLVPIETVAAVVEVKLTLTKDEFAKADAAATETARLRLRGHVGSNVPRSSGMGWTTSTMLTTDEEEHGVPIDDPQLEFSRPTFAIFAFGGIKEIETIAQWLCQAKTIGLICCLEAGCAVRHVKHSTICQPAQALTRFAECLRGAIDRHESLIQGFKPNFRRYSEIDVLKYWDGTGYEHPDTYEPMEEELAARARLYDARPALRPR